MSSSSSSPPLPLSRNDFYERLLSKASSLLSSTRDVTANLSNVSALLYQSLQDEYGASSVNWCGFYLYKHVHFDVDVSSSTPSTSSHLLVVGPFQGRPAVPLIPLSQGVCGACVRARTTQLVDDVHAYPQHIVCDERSRSEIVVPVFQASSLDQSNEAPLLAVLDVDCPEVKGFNEEDQRGLERLCRLVAERSEWSLWNREVALGHPISENEEVLCPTTRA